MPHDHLPGHESGPPDDTGRPDDPNDGATFAGLGLRPELMTALDELGYEEPTPIQLAAIPPLVDGRDVLGQAATGTGKTAAFALPILQRLRPRSERSGAPEAIVLVPTRELALQVSEAMTRYGRHLGVRIVPIYGGQPIHRQFQQLERGADVVVATPGRAVDHIGRGSLPLDEISIVVLDEADEMLDMGFADDLEAILSSIPEGRQTVLFSATLPRRIASIAAAHQSDPVHVRIAAKAGTTGAASITQRAYVVQRNHKPTALGRILDLESPGATLVFCRTRSEVDRLTSVLNGRGYRAEALHGGLDQTQRDRVMGRLRDGSTELLVATDVAARGIDVDTLTHVVNYDLPSAPESYVHRIGRVGRANRTGVAITLAEPKEQRHLTNIERLTGQPIELASVPTTVELRDRRLEQTTEALAAALERDDLDAYAPALDQLDRLTGTEDHDDLRRIALAAIAIAHEASAPAGDDEGDVPDARRTLRPEQRREQAPKRSRTGSLDDRARDNDEPTGFLHISLGRFAGIRPADLVGAIANEVDLPGRQIGPIRIADQYSVVGIPERVVERAIAALGGSQIRGQEARVRRFVDHGDDRPERGKRSDGPKRPASGDRSGPDRAGAKPRGPRGSADRTKGGTKGGTTGGTTGGAKDRGPRGGSSRKG
ncbi:MAG: DEAD/DEAH box helicase, partial [Ilumatobacteraceae bacterium]